VSPVKGPTSSGARTVRVAAGRRAMPYTYLLPAGLIVAFVFAYPVVTLLISSVQVQGIAGAHHYGIDNFKTVLANDLFWSSIKNNLRLFLAVPVMSVGALLIAAVLYDNVRGRGFYRSIVFLPYVLPIPVIGVVFSYILQRNGVLNETFADLHLNWLVHDWLGNPNLAIWSIWGIIVWQQLGFGVVLFLARLTSVDPVLYEAALIDRANWWQRFRYITVPQTARVMEFFVTVSLLNMLSWVFSYIFVMTSGGPSNSTYVVELLIYNTAFRDGLFNVAAATSVVVLVFALIVLFFQSMVRKRLEAAL
jgi:ABC-type sugar transport system permease subunit